ncbi:MAG: histidine phosphatase family protein [Clostridia bacterium]|nr:histidine phosphatase family protein [Clostridia bacterium]
MSEGIQKFEIFYIRHADVVGGSHGDRDVCDRDLTELGEKQILLLGERFAGKSFDAIFSSPLIRCVKTAAAVANRLEGHPQIEIMPELIENGSTYGYKGLPVEELKKYYDNVIECPDNIYGEDGIFEHDTKEKNMIRAKAVNEYFRKRFGFGKKILVFAHACIGNSVIQTSVSVPYEHSAFRMTLFNTSVTKLKYTSDGVERVSFHNDVSHLRSIMPDYEFEL